MSTRIAAACVLFVAAAVSHDAAQRAPGAAAEIAGRVTTTGEPRLPLARVLVTIGSPSLAASRTVVTGEDGRFGFSGLAAGTYTVEAFRPPYVKTAFGARRPGRPGTPIAVAAGQRVIDLTIPLARGGAITGAIRSPEGEPAPDVAVQAMSLDAQAGAAATAISDDRGVYRLFGLAPGRYRVTATVNDGGRTSLTQLSDDDIDAIIARLERRSIGGAAAPPFAAPARSANAPAPPPTYGYAPIHFPGTPDPDLATSIAIGEGDERSGVDIDLRLVRTVTIDGQVAGPSGVLPPDTTVVLTRAGAGISTTLFSTANSRRPEADGRFQFTGVLPGKYRVTARARPAAGDPAGALWAIADAPEGQDITGLTLTLQPGLRVSGRIVFDSRAQSPPDATRVTLRLTSVTADPWFIPPSAASADGTFEIAGAVPGRYTIASPLSDGGWWLRSAVVDGRDVLDTALEIGAADVSGVVVTFTDRHTELTGTLTSAESRPAPEHFVVVFAADRRFWLPGSRRVQFTRPGTDGRFSVRDLPAGDYLLAALTDLEPLDLLDAAFVEQLVPAAVPIRIDEGGTTRQDLRIGR